jgi:hypothetical protein
MARQIGRGPGPFERHLAAIVGRADVEANGSPVAAHRQRVGRRVQPGVGLRLGIQATLDLASWEGDRAIDQREQNDRQQLLPDDHGRDGKEARTAQSGYTERPPAPLHA